MSLKSIDYIESDKATLQKISPEQAWHYHIVPMNISDETETYAIDETRDIVAVQAEMEIISGKEIELQPFSQEVIIKSLNKYYLKKRSNKQFVDSLKSEDDNFVVNLIEDARDLGSSDIHVERYEERCRVRIRIDGQLVERFSIDPGDFPSIINKIKIMAQLDIAEKRLPQDGRIFFNQKGYKFDIRVSSLPTLHGEKIVLRILGSDASSLDIADLGLSEQNLKMYSESIKKPNGIILISGPTGSGKTTTLYATLKRLNLESKNILTIEDPIEYTLEGINQVQLKESIGLDFGKSLRTFLRQDPDIIMVGEIRDPDTANMAIRAALTGHLVLSTVHTNSAWGIISRLLDMGIPPYLLASTLNAGVAQRLVRKLCPHCKRKATFSPDLYPSSFNLGDPVSHHYLPEGCDHCFHTGYSGRQAIYEVISIDRELSEKIKSADLNIDSLLKKKGVKSLAESAHELFVDGTTSLQEIYPILAQN